MKERNKTIDNAKGIGIILVIAGHLYTKDSIPFMYIFSFHMPLFFIISGYLMNADKYSTLIECAKTSFVRYVKPYFAFCIIGFFITLPVNGGDFLGKYTLTQLTTRILYETFWTINPFVFFMGSLWFVIVLFLSIVFGWFLIKKLWKSQWKFYMLVVLPIISYGLYIFQNLSFMPEYAQQSLPLKIASVPVCTMFILLGYELKIRKFEFKLSYVTLFTFLAVVVVIPYNGSVNISIPYFGNMVLFVMNAILGSYTVLSLSSIKFPKFIEWFGQNSLIIFATHGVWIIVYTQVIKFLFGYSELLAIHRITGLLIVVGLSLPTVKIVTPLLNYILRKI